MDKVIKLYELIEPIVDLIEANKEEIISLVLEIRGEIDTSSKDWAIIDELESALLDFSLSGGDTAVKDLKEIIEGN